VLFFWRRENLCKKGASVAVDDTGEALSGEMIQESENPMKMTTFRSSVLRVAILAIGATALSALPAMAQDASAPPPPQGQDGPRRGGGPGRMGEHQVEFLTKKLSLTPDQVTQVKAIDDDSRKQMMALRDDTSTAGPDRRSKMMDIHKASQSKIRALLTADQQTKFDALEAEMREHRGRRGGPDGPPPPPPPPAPQQ
jgi:protein CpxP